MAGPYAVVFRFTAKRPFPPPVPEAMHAAFLDLVNRADPALAATLHAQGHRIRPYTLALLGPRLRKELHLRLGVLSPELFLHFWDRWERGGGLRLRLGQRWLAPVEVERKGPWAGETPWSTFSALPPTRRVLLAFCTPTTFRQGDVDLPLPLPKLLFSGLMLKWNAASPEPLELNPEDFSRYLALAKARIRTLAVWDGRARVWGFVGPVEFRVKRDAPESFCRAVAMLSAFSFYSGAGRHTTHGFGLVRLIHAA